MNWLVGALMLLDVVFYLALAGQIAKIDELEDRIKAAEIWQSRHTSPSAPSKMPPHGFWRN
jgi:hypothetical protein